MAPRGKKGKLYAVRHPKEYVEGLNDPSSFGCCESATEMRDLLSGLYLNPKYSDLTITCGTEVFSAHRNIVCPRSAFFAGACDGKFKEASEGKVEICEREPILVKKVLEYLYTGDYTFQAPESRPDDGVFDCERVPEQALTPEEMPLAGQGYPQVKDPAEGESHEPQEWPLSESPPRDGSVVLMSQPVAARIRHPSCFHALMYDLADFLQIDGLKREAKTYFREAFLKHLGAESFEAAVMEVYSSKAAKYDRRLKELVVDLTMDELPTLRSGTTPVLKDDFLEMTPDFAIDLCVAMLDKYPNQHIWQY